MALAAAIAEANREKAVTLPALGAERTSSSKPEKRLGDLVHSESMPRMLGEMKGPSQCLATMTIRSGSSVLHVEQLLRSCGTTVRERSLVHIEEVR